MRFRTKKSERIIIYTDKESKKTFKELAKRANVSMSALGRVFIGITDIIKNAVKDAIREVGVLTTSMPQIKSLERLTPPPPSLKHDPALAEYRQAFRECIGELKEVLKERKKEVDEYSKNES